MKTTSRTGQKQYAFDSAPRCGARTKGNFGRPCRCPVVKGKSRCRVHGGAKGSGAPKGNRNALKNGGNTAEVKLFRAQVRWVIQNSKNIFKNTD
ncbi:TPA: HGGxSTG domain-containing protein [Legionella pneumophila]